MATFERPPWAGTGARGTALVLPGGAGGVFQGSIYWLTLALAESGWDLLAAEWPVSGDREAAVEPIAEEGIRRLAGSSASLVIGKSLGSLAAPVVATVGLPAVWLTPLLDRPRVAGAIESAVQPTLAVGGTADATWRRLEPRGGLEVHEITGANHGLVIPGDWRLSLRRTEELVQRVVVFVEGLAE